jgi:hypothetical protein
MNRDSALDTVGGAALLVGLTAAAVGIVTGTVIWWTITGVEAAWRAVRPRT